MDEGPYTSFAHKQRGGRNAAAVTSQHLITKGQRATFVTDQKRSQVSVRGKPFAPGRGERETARPGDTVAARESGTESAY